MSFLLNILIGAAVLLIGILMVLKTSVVQSFTGPIPFAEEKMGVGETPVFLKLLGVLVAFLGILIMTDIIGDVLSAIASLFIPQQR